MAARPQPRGSSATSACCRPSVKLRSTSATRVTVCEGEEEARENSGLGIRLIRWVVFSRRTSKLVAPPGKCQRGRQNSGRTIKTVTGHVRGACDLKDGRVVGVNRVRALAVALAQAVGLRCWPQRGDTWQISTTSGWDETTKATYLDEIRWSRMGAPAHEAFDGASSGGQRQQPSHSCWAEGQLSARSGGQLAPGRASFDPRGSWMASRTGRAFVQRTATWKKRTRHLAAVMGERRRSCDIGKLCHCSDTIQTTAEVSIYTVSEATYISRAW